MKPPYRLADPLREEAFAKLRRDAIFDCCKWDPQVGDVAVLAPAPLILEAGAWRMLARWSEQLATETLAAEAALAQQPALHPTLGLPRVLRRALTAAAGVASADAVPGSRIMRFDFHFTAEGWRISEVNADVPGGLNEAEGFTALMQRHHPRLGVAPGVATALARAVLRTTNPGAPVGLVHATAYSDDRQVMAYLGRAIEIAGGRVEYLAPDHVAWREGRAFVDAAWSTEELGAIVRFYPAEWMPALPRATAWGNFFAPTRTPQTNPATALLPQSKRFPLVWDELPVDLPAWRALLPATADPRSVDLADETWVLKPAWGRIGEDIGMSGVTPPADLKKIRRAARWHASQWVAQRRFTCMPVSDGEHPWHPCLGVYVVNGTACGLYGRMAQAPLINARALDVAVLIEENDSVPEIPT
ncbi:MAG TPA: glutathionylspermidine synthase family protein [Kiritimatiellia bacterium]|nr:glutathionylspermidine synthase family protein [Kiritimatiellia bacterium]